MSLQYFMKKCGINNDDMNSYIDFTYTKQTRALESDLDLIHNPETEYSI